MGTTLNTIGKLVNQNKQYQLKQEVTKKLVSKWSKYGLLDGLNQSDASIMATLLDTQAKELLLQATQTGGTQGSQEWSGIALPLVRKVFGSIPAKEFVSVQPMDRPAGLVFYLDFKYGTAKVPYSKDDSLYGTTNGANSPIGGFYGQGRFSYSINTHQERIGTGSLATGSVTEKDLNYNATVSTGSVKKLLVTVDPSWQIDTQAVRSFAVTVKSGSTNIIDTYYPQFTTYDRDNSKVVFVVKPASGKTIDVSSNDVDFYYAPSPANAYSRGDFQYRDGDSGYNIPDLDIKFKSQGIIAKTRKLKATWTPQSAQDMKVFHSVDAEQQITNILSQHITTQIDLQILSMLLENADTIDYWSANPGYEYNKATNQFAINDVYQIIDKAQWFRTLGIKIQSVSNTIHQKTMRGGANFMVVSPRVASIVQSMNGFTSDFTGNDTKDFSIGVVKFGTIDKRITVYTNPYATDNIILMGYRGNSFLETGAVYAPYIPFITTPIIFDPETLVPRKGIMTRYGKKMIRNEFYGAIVIHGMETI